MRVYIPGAPNDGAYAGICFGGGGGGSSSSDQQQSTSNQDNRVGADSGAIVAQGGSKVTQINQSSDPAVILAALQTVEKSTDDAAALGALSITASNATAVTLGGDAIAAGQDTAHLALQTGQALAIAGLSAGSTVAAESLGGEEQAIAAAFGIANQALAAAEPAQALLRMILVAGTVTAVVFFISRAR